MEGRSVPGTGLSSTLSPRLQLKRAFCRYYLQVCGTEVADPTDAYAACDEYLAWRERALGRPPTDDEVAEEILQLGGELEQDLIRRGAYYRQLLAEEPLVRRLQECMQVARRRRRGEEL